MNISIIEKTKNDIFKYLEDENIIIDNELSADIQFSFLQALMSNSSEDEIIEKALKYITERLEGKDYYNEVFIKVKRFQETRM